MIRKAYNLTGIELLINRCKVNALNFVIGPFAAVSHFLKKYKKLSQRRLKPDADKCDPPHTLPFKRRYE